MRQWLVWLALLMGCSNHTHPPGMVHAAGLWVGQTEVTNQQFAEFTDQTHYLTTAEQLGGSVVFTQPRGEVSLDNPLAWWSYQQGVDWRSVAVGHPNYPVTHVSYEDAEAYARWVGKRLPTAAEWEALAKGDSQWVYPWGPTLKLSGRWMANTYQGEFPHRDTGEDGWAGLAPVASFPPNSFGLYDVIGNVWEWTSTPDPANPGSRITKGGSFLCSENYCSNYRVDAQGTEAEDTGTSNLGFRLVR